MPPPPTGRPRGGSLCSIFSIWTVFPTTAVERTIFQPRRAPRGALRRGAIINRFAVLLPQSGTHDPEKSEVTFRSPISNKALRRGALVKMMISFLIFIVPGGNHAQVCFTRAKKRFLTTSVSIPLHSSRPRVLQERLPLLPGFSPALFRLLRLQPRWLHQRLEAEIPVRSSPRFLYLPGR